MPEPNPYYAKPAPNLAPFEVLHKGTAMLDFGSTPRWDTTLYVGGQADILSSSQIRVSLQGDTSGTNSETDYLLAASSISLAAGGIVPGSGFTIYADSTFALWTGRFRVRWRWS